MQYPRGRLELVSVGGKDVWRMIPEPGWRYSESMGPREGTDLCPAEHSLWLLIPGRLAAQMSDGTTTEYGCETVPVLCERFGLTFQGG